LKHIFSKKDFKNTRTPVSVAIPLPFWKKCQKDKLTEGGSAATNMVYDIFQHSRG